MGTQPWRIAQTQYKPAIEQVITSLQRLKYADAGRNGSTESAAFLPEGESNKDEGLTIGLAISGGVDSMALASMCSQLQSKVNNTIKPRFRAFVVDHGVRSTSKDEAASVAKTLESKNIPTSILKIEWPTDIDPKSSPKFESLARTFRFQALGRACRDHNINALFLAHHQDDQAETLLMRLVNGHWKRGLMGMRQSAPIPECHGIYGVDRSGGNRHQPELSETVAGSLEIESGGVLVHRPLLNFTKTQLRQTCEENDMPWFEDHTNADPRVTMRNAIRHIYANHSLPVALQKPSLLAMLSRLQKQKEEAALQRQELWSRKMQVQHFDARLPLMILRTEWPTDAESRDDKTPQMLLEVLKQAMESISAVQNIEIKSLLPVLASIFPSLRPHLERQLREFLCLGEPLLNKLNKAGLQFTCKQWGNYDNLYGIWILTPEKAYRNRAPHLRIEPSRCAPLEDHIQDPDSWQLWDGRYWVNICNQTSHTLCLQHRSTVEASKGVAHHNRQLFRRVKDALGQDASVHLAAAGHALPALTIEDGEDKGRIVAFPTFGIVDEEYQGRMSCAMRYKNVDGYL